MSKDAAIRRALDALRAEDPEHPGIDALEAYVEGRLSAEDRRRIDELALQLPMVAEDLADLQRMHDQLPRPAARRQTEWRRVAAVAGIAASVAVVIWLARPQPVQAPVTVTRLAPAEQEVVQAAITRGTIELSPSVRDLIGSQLTLLGPSGLESFRLLKPLGTAVRSQRPAFSWTDAGAEAYTVAVFDETFAPVLSSGRVTGTSWTPSTDLPRARLMWQVTAHRGGADETEPRPPRPEARFVIADAAAAARYDDAMARLQGEPLALGILLAEAGFIDDARVALTRAAESDATADAARRLLLSLTQGTPTTTKPAQ